MIFQQLIKTLDWGYMFLYSFQMFYDSPYLKTRKNMFQVKILDIRWVSSDQTVQKIRYNHHIIIKPNDQTSAFWKSILLLVKYKSDQRWFAFHRKIHDIACHDIKWHTRRIDVKTTKRFLCCDKYVTSSTYFNLLVIIFSFTVDYCILHIHYWNTNIFWRIFSPSDVHDIHYIIHTSCILTVFHVWKYWKKENLYQNSSHK